MGDRKGGEGGDEGSMIHVFGFGFSIGFLIMK